MNQATSGRGEQYGARRYTQACTRLVASLCSTILCSHLALAQEQVDQLDRQKQADAAIQRLTLRVRVTHCLPEASTLLVDWRRGGEGLGGTVTRGEFPPDAEKAAASDTQPQGEPGKREGIRFGQWSAWLPVESICGRSKSWAFPSVTVSYLPQGKKQLDPPRETTVEFEVAEDGRVFKRWTEKAPRGATVGFAFPAGQLDGRGARNEEFVSQLGGLAAHVQARRARLEQRFAETIAPPRRFAILGHLAGYGEAPGSGLGKAIGFGVRHCNPDIVADECRVLELLGVNGLVDEKSLRAVELAGQADKFRRLYWGGPGSGSPMAAVSSRGASEPDGCPFDPRLKTTMAEQVERAIAQHQASGAQEKWALWWDEIGVAAKAHLQQCPRCRDEFRDYLRRHRVQPADVGASNWDDVAPFPLWDVESTKTGLKQTLAAPPAVESAADRLRYYYSYRFMTYATANLFPESARQLAAAGIPLYAMQGPTPSWNGSSLDWHEFYDTQANTALVWETSNRDPRAWQWESYLADILRGVSQRHHGLPMGCLVKPHRGAPAQRMLAGVTRGVRVVEWYTYGPDYAKGDSFSQSPELLEEVAQASRFLAQSEPYLWESQREQRPEVALVFPRSSEIWGRVGPLGMTALENAKWTYLALRHEHIPVSILSEQQLATGVPDHIRVLYVVGPNLRRDSLTSVETWVRRGGWLWTDALGLSRDEADQASESARTLLGIANRKLEMWGKTPEYRATTLEAFGLPTPPAAARLSWNLPAPWGEGGTTAVVGREPLELPASAGSAGAEATSIKARFADQQIAMIDRKVGTGRVVVLGLWAGLTYSSTVRRGDYDMDRDFSLPLRRLITSLALERNITRPAVPAHPLVEAVALRSQAGRSVALMNWCYSKSPQGAGNRGEKLREQEALTVELAGWSGVQRVRSMSLKTDLKVEQHAAGIRVTLPKLDAIDLLIADP